MAREQLAWTPIDMNNLSKPVQTAWDDYQNEKSNFENVVTAQLKKKGLVPDGKSLRFAYRGSDVAYAVADAATVRNKVSL